MNRIVAALSKLLEPEERECACGDLEEWRLSVPAAAANILGLVVRRQLAEWARLIVDTRNVMAGVKVAAGKVWKA